MKLRRLKLVHVIPDIPEATFQVVERTPGLNYWHIVMHDFQDDEGLQLTHKLPKKSKHPYPTAQQVANAAAGQMANATGYAILTRYHDGIPVYSGIWISNSVHVWCRRESGVANP